MLRDKGIAALMCVFAGLGVWTLLPGGTAKPNDLGYFSVCPFAPWSSLALLAAAFALGVIRRYFQTRPEVRGKLERID